jgi:toxin FitB
MYLLDTNVVSELRKGKKADRGVRTWAQPLVTASFYLSAISILELETSSLAKNRDVFRNELCVIRSMTERSR